MITAAADATAVVRFYRKANVALDVEADRQVALPRSHYQLFQVVLSEGPGAL